MMWLLRMLAVVLLVALGLLFAAALRIFYLAFIRHEPPHDPRYEPLSNHIPKAYRGRFHLARAWMLDPRRNMELVRIRGVGNVNLMGYLLPASACDRFVVLIHGYHSSSMNDFGCAVKYYHRLGYGVLMTDMRAHGASGGRIICFGLKERHDAKRWVEYLERRFGPDISVFVHGLSMGATTALMATADDLPRCVKGVIADCGFTSPDAIVRHLMRRNYRMNLPPLLWALSLIFRLSSGYWLWSDSTLNAMRKCKLPILLIHGAEDDFVPTDMSRQNHAACTAQSQLFIVPGAPHALSYLVDTNGYVQHLQSFLEAYR